MTEARALIKTVVVVSFFELAQAGSEYKANQLVFRKLREEGIPIQVDNVIEPKLTGVERGELTYTKDLMTNRLIFTWTHEADA